MSKNGEIDLSGVTVAMAVTDAVPVFLFGGSCVLVAVLFHSLVFLIGACFCLLAGLGKVLWKLIAALGKRNVTWLNHQFAYIMILGCTCMLLSVIIGYQQISFTDIWNSIVASRAVWFFAIGVIGIIVMAVLARVMDDGVRANWTEQITNSIAQLGFFLGMVLLVIQ